MAKVSLTLSMVVMVGIIQQIFSADAAAQSATHTFVELAAMPDFTGLYASEPPAPNCGITTSASPIESPIRAIYIEQSGNVMRMRNVPTQNVRVLYIQSRRQAAYKPYASTRNGLARWDGDAIVVASRLPALPLWSHPRAPQLEGALFEHFAVTGIHLTYRAWYEPSGEFREAAPFEVTLTKCAGVLLNASDRP